MNEFDDLMDHVYPKHYQEFRRLYNELLGYLERDEFDKIKALSNRLNQSLQRALQLNMSIDQRFKAMNRQKNIAIKELFHERFRNPKNTIEITHFFPLKSRVTKTADDLTAPSSLVKERQVEALITEMAKYDQTTKDPAPWFQDVKTEDVSNVLADRPNGRAFLHQPGHVPNDTDESPDGVSLSNEFADGSLYIRGGGSNDARRSKEGTDAVHKNSDDSVPKKTSRRSSDRRSRIWDYIHDDQSSGGISHDL